MAARRVRGGIVSGPAAREAAERIAAARDAGLAIGALPATCRPADLAQGYEAQAALHALLDARGRDEVVGYKIGCTTAVMQAFLDIPHPCAGRMRSAGVHHGDARIALAGHVRLAVEAEVAVTLGDALVPARAPFDRDSVAAAIATCHASIEVVDDRYENFRALGVPTLVADDFFHVGCILGAGRADWRSVDLAALACTLRVNGRREAEGRGADIMGHPLEALIWLADHAAARGETIPSGATVTLGSMVETRWIDAPCTVEVEIEGLAPARATFV